MPLSDEQMAAIFPDGPKWDSPTPTDVIKALEDAGYVIVPEAALRELRKKASEVLGILGGGPT